MTFTCTCALVTGATSGIGKELAYLLARRGIPLILSGRTISSLQALEKELGATVVVADLATSEGRAALVEVIREKKPDLVVNNAGYGLYGDLIDSSLEEQADVLQVNAQAVLTLSQAAAKALRTAKKGGVILNVASVAAFFSFPGFSVYAASKRFVLQFSEALDEELSPFGIRVLTSCPGMVDTQFRSRAAGEKQDADPLNALPVSFAAKEIWWQICKRKRTHIFDWRYRWITFFCRSFVPKKWLLRFLHRRILSRLKP